MKPKESGDYFELPILGLKIEKFIFTGLLTLVFNDEENSYLDIHSSFRCHSIILIRISTQEKGKGRQLIFYNKS